jgi:hypothetical protein
MYETNKDVFLINLGIKLFVEELIQTMGRICRQRSHLQNCIKRKHHCIPGYQIGNTRMQNILVVSKCRIWWLPMTALIMQSIINYQDKRQKIKIDDK